MDEQSMNTRLAKLETAFARIEALSSVHRRDMEKIEALLDRVFERIAASERRYYTALGGGLVLLFLIEKLFFK